MSPACRVAVTRAVLMAVAPVLLAGDLAPCAAQSARFEDAFAWADSVLEHAVAEELVPGAVLLVARDGRVLHERAFGFAQLYEYGGTRLAEPDPMTTEHVFDLASVTKVMATTMAVMLLVDRGHIDLDAPVHTYLPDFRGPEKDGIRVRDLLTHGAGLYQWLPTYYHARKGAAAYEHVRDLPLAFPVGERRRYSDLGFMLLGHIVDRVSGQSLDVFLDQNLYGPLGLTSTAFNPRDKRLGPFAATSHGNPYERRMVEDEEFGYRVDEDPDGFRDWREYTLLGEVNDGNAYYAHGGVAGHAGLFSTASELRVLLDLLLNEGVHEGRRMVARATVAEFLRPQAFGNGLGWMVASGSAGDARPAGSFSHGGFTGTYVMGVPEHGLAIILLTNRQNLGVDEAGYYPNVGDVRRSIVERITQAAADETDS